MARKKKGGKKTDDQAGGDSSSNQPESSGSHTAPEGLGGGQALGQQERNNNLLGGGDAPQAQGKPSGSQQQPQQGGRQKAPQGAQQQRAPSEKTQPQQQGAGQGSNQPQQQGGKPQGAWGPKGTQQQKTEGPQQQGSRPKGGQKQQQHEQPRGPPQDAQQQQGGRQPQQPGAWATQGAQQQRGQQPQQGPRPAQGSQQQRGPQQQQQGPAQGAQQQRGAQPQQQGPWPAPGAQQQRGPQPQQGPQQQRGPQPQQGPQQQRGPQPQQGPWQTQGAQQQRAPQPQQGPQQQRGPQPQQQGPWQTQGAQQQRGPQPQQGSQQQRGPQPQQGAQQQRGPQPQQQGPWQTQGQQPPQQGQRQRGPPQQTQPQGAVPKTQTVVPYGSKDLTTDMQRLTTKGRPGGTQGRKITVETNYLGIDFGRLPIAYHYDVQITPDTPKRWLRDVFEQFRRKFFPRNHPAFDGKRNMYSPCELMNRSEVITDEIEFEVPHEDKKKSFKVSVQFATEVDLSPLRNMRVNNSQQAMQCVEIVLRSAASVKCIQAGRSFYTRPPSIIPLGDGMEMYYGFYQTVVRGWKPFFNVDVAHKAFPKSMNVIQLIAELSSDYRTTVRPEDLRNTELDYKVQEKLNKFLKTLRVTYEIPGMKREYRVNGIDKPPRKSMFTVDNRTMSIEEYFQRKKNYRLNYPLMPTLWVGSAARKDKILLPAELCTVVENQAVNRKMNENQTTAMIKQAATSTNIRKDKIMNSLSTTRHNDDPCIKEFGFRINSDFERVEARVLQPPALEYKDGQCMPRAGVWRADNNKFFKGAEAASWVIISLCGNLARECSNLANLIANQSSRSGMRLNPNPERFDCVQSRFPNQRDVNTIMDKYVKCNLIFVVIPDSGPVYSMVKKAAEIKLNCLTQCIRRKTLMKMNPSTVGNILLKVNSKLNGTNHCLKFKPSLLNEPCMIMGADVTHPSPDSTNIPSVVAVTASHDPRAQFGYNMCCRLQLPKVEIIEDLEEITVEHLKYFYQKNQGQKPYKIIIFRDGVSEGQFAEVRQTELTAIRRACSRMEEGYQPKITFIVVQKRHHTRFFPNKSDSEDRNCNVPAGTCVDTVITSPNIQDFYLVSHASIQGVAKPTKYSTLWDDNELSYDEVEQLAYYLCHLFSRCNRSVSYPAPTYYAHLGAARAKVYIENEQINFQNLQTEHKKLKNDEIRKRQPMFFV